MPRYQIITLVDITRTNPTRVETDKLKLAQQANFNSLLQSIGLRSNVSWVKDPVVRSGRLPHPLDGAATHWQWTFDAERDEVFLKDSDPVGLLKDDLNGIPIIANLTNSVELDPACFFTYGDKTNIWVEEIV
jgi:hypothetical protein